jgi:hypothetical protein
MAEDKQPNIVVTDKRTPLDQQPEPIRDKPWYTKLGRRLIAFVFVLATFFLFGGIYQLGLFQQTPASTPAGEYQPVIAQKLQRIPVTVYVLDQSNRQSPPATTTKRLIERTNAVLTQACVQLSPATTSVITTSDLQSTTGRLAASPESLKKELPQLRSDRLHIIVAQGLGGINGVAFPGQRVVAVSEYTTSFDFRVLAHEVGHILSLDHVSDKSNLMYSGSTGTELTEAQARVMNQQARGFTN